MCFVSSHTLHCTFPSPVKTKNFSDSFSRSHANSFTSVSLNTFRLIGFRCLTSTSFPDAVFTALIVVQSINVNVSFLSPTHTVFPFGDHATLIFSPCVGIDCTSFFCRTSQNFTVLSEDTDTSSSVCTGLNRSCSTESRWPSKRPFGMLLLLFVVGVLRLRLALLVFPPPLNALSASHTRIVWSTLPDAKYSPLKLKSSEFTFRSCAKSSTVLCLIVYTSKVCVSTIEFDWKCVSGVVE